MLALRRRPGLAEAMHGRLLPVYGEVIPSLGTGGPPPGALWFAVGPEAQLARYESELRVALGPKAAVTRLYPRDFWDFAGR
jgi:hypothetical protein